MTTSPIKPPVQTGTAARSIQISDWRPHEKNTLRGFFTITLQSGMIIHDVMLHEKAENRWISFPAREWTDQQNQKQFVRFIDFRDRATADRFRDQVLAALDAHFQETKA